MYIDFHTHAFADSIAHKAISRLESVSGLKAYTDGTSYKAFSAEGNKRYFSRI